MTETYKLAHISDVHLAPLEGFHPRYWNVKRGLGYLNWQRKRRFVHSRSVADMIAADALAQGPDHIAVTGDLANLGLPGEYEAAFQWLCQLGSPERVSAIPGNHDIYTARLHGASCLERWAPFMKSDAWGESMGGAATGAFPYLRRVGPLALIGLNSAVPTPPFVAAGRLGGPQLAALAALLDRIAPTRLLRVVLIHHPPLPGQAPPLRALEDAARFDDVLAEHGADLVLHGHNHRDMLAWRQWSKGHVPVVGVASGSAAKAHKSEAAAQYNIFRFAKRDDAVEIECITRGLSVSGSEIVELRRRRLDPPLERGPQRTRA